MYEVRCTLVDGSEMDLGYHTSLADAMHNLAQELQAEVIRNENHENGQLPVIEMVINKRSYAMDIRRFFEENILTHKIISF